MFFHDYVLAWWQFGLFKLSLIALGIIIGAAWPAVFKKKSVWTILWLVFALLAIYIMAALWPQI